MPVLEVEPLPDPDDKTAVAIAIYKQMVNGGASPPNKYGDIHVTVAEDGTIMYEQEAAE